MSHSQQFFSSDYFIARDRFRELTTKANGQLHSIALDARGPKDEDLSIDIAWFGADRPRRVLLHSSGIHGVEGFAGSAIQLQLLRDLPALPEDAALIVVHSLNPYGMTYLRRVNENNVDLNRNFLDKRDDPKTVRDLQKAQTGYGTADSFLNPPSPPRSDLYKLQACLLICKYGKSPLKQAVVGGQYWFPKGLFYGGKFLVQPGRIRSERQQGAKEYQAFLAERLSSTESVLAIDVHTGLGKFATDTLLVEENEKEVRAIFGDRVTPLNPRKGVAYHAWGSAGSMLSHTLPNANVLFVTQEFGTYSAINVLHSLREENRWHHYGSGALNHPTKQKLKETFCPDDETWRESVLNRGKELVRQGLSRMRVHVPIMSGTDTSCCSQGQEATPRLIYRDNNGRELTETDLANATGTVNWSIIDSQNISQKAQELHSRARQAGGSGDYKKALELLALASKEAPDWPYPLYDAAFTYLLMGKPDKALELYEVVNKMVPRGFFTVQTAVHSLRLEKETELQPGTYKQYALLEWVSNPVEKKALLEKMVRQSPNFAPAWKELSNLLDGDTAILQAIGEGLSHNPDDTTKGFLLANKALALNRQGKHEDAVRILGDLSLDPNVPLEIEQLAKAVLANVVRSS